MVLLDKIWDDVAAGPQPESGLGRLRKVITKPSALNIKDVEGSTLQKSMSMPASSVTPATPSTPATPGSARKENVWRSVFNPGSNLATRGLGTEMFDKPSQPNSPTVYDWLYSGETRSKHR
uniref:Auxin-repressed protein n=1 Tax=Elaeagnus umbellata TaxID=43233 RepID=O82561_ELAUM|nr:auxin-repressed protein [Elaeagnus umbellata]